MVGVSQPFWLYWPDGIRHAPDYFARRRDGSALVVDVRDDDRISPDDQQKFDRSAAVCDSVGWDYRRVGVLDSVLRANLRWLSGIDILECPDRPWPVNSWGCLHEPDR